MGIDGYFLGLVGDPARKSLRRPGRPSAGGEEDGHQQVRVRREVFCKTWVSGLGAVERWSQRLSPGVGSVSIFKKSEEVRK